MAQVQAIPLSFYVLLRHTLLKYVLYASVFCLLDEVSFLVSGDTGNIRLIRSCFPV